MGFLTRLFGGTDRCPACGKPMAKLSLFSTQCLAQECIHYDPGYAHEFEERRIPNWQETPPVTFERSVRIHYTNWMDEAREFTADATSLRRRRQHISACVAPTGQRIALKADRIANLAELKPHLPSEQSTVTGPTPDEARVMRFHHRRGTTSELNESLRAKYPDFRP
jgi:hypothetical protein